VDDGKVRVARQALLVLARESAVKREELAARQALKRGEVEAARLELANLELERREAVLLAPVDGVVTAGEVRVGDVLEPGKPVLEIAEQEGFVFEVLVPTEEAADLRLGMPARVKLDAYDCQRYGTLPGRVCYIAPDSTVDQGVTAYQVKVALEQAELRRGDLRGPVKLGMAGRAEILTERRSLLSLLGKQIRRSISLE
jgi:HlyD family secretion protein